MEWLVVSHSAILLALIALQFRAASRSDASEFEKTSRLWLPVCRALTVVGIAATPIGFYFDGVVGLRAAFAGIIVAATGFARLRRWHNVTRWFRWLELAAWCLCILAIFGIIARLIVVRQFGAQ